MTKIQALKDGSFKITIPRSIALGKNWKGGDELGFCVVDLEVNRPLPGDVFLRKNR